jgi:FkbM family methyltransferase
MRNLKQRIAFVLAPTSHGPLILNRLDYRIVPEGQTYGVGIETLEASAYHPEEIAMSVFLLDQRRKHFGDGVQIIDCGANIGVHTIEWARHMTGWGRVIAIEAQERIFYALAGNIALNNCFNATALHAAAAAADGAMMIPEPDYLQPASFGSLELKPRPDNEFIGQAIDYSAAGTVEVRCLKLDSLPLERVDFIKIDVEAMEPEVLEGAAQLIALHHPIIMVEWIKSAKPRLAGILQGAGYQVFQAGMNLLAVHPSDATLGQIKATPLDPVGPQASQ